MLIPITVWIGMEQAFIGADFTQVGPQNIKNIEKYFSNFYFADIYER